ncbi:unnamed protein product [Polarella glacialis]|uniref:BTB domain-containing protein n=1 Tax=Polarella glacialis TaxID=89957 RepID=A0A813DN88_POLGL|nr:unnamed protein product [Polarella glacialis]CAE8647751.1 unnamed protein product [Polarella glacialis]
MALALGCWERFEDHDAPSDDPSGHAVRAASPEDVAVCMKECLSLGFGGFVVRKEKATFRPLGRLALIDQRTSGFWGRGAILYVVPDEAAVHAAELLHPIPGEERVEVTLEGGEEEEACFAAEASASILKSRSGYFESAFRHNWQDGVATEGVAKHCFKEFPGGSRAFEFAMAWLSTAEGKAVGSPWPILDCADACALTGSAAYLDSPSLLRAAARSWRLAAARGRQELLQVAGAVAEASPQFGAGHGQELVVQELRDLLQEMPKHHLQLAPEFAASPVTGLAALEARHSARETLVGHIKTVGNWVGSVIGGESRRAPTSEDNPHDFAAQLFELHEPYFVSSPPELRRLLRHVDPTHPIPAPLCFRLAAAAASAAAVAEDEVFAGHRLALDIFERSLGAESDPASAASDDACAVGLFGAGLREPTSPPALGLEILARPLVPPAAAAVILGRVLASWAARSPSSEGGDAAEVIFAGVVANRQGLRTMLSAALPRIEAEDRTNQERGSSLGGAAAMARSRSGESEWGSCFDLAVPELRAAFQGAAAAAVDRAGLAGEGIADETLSLLFRVLFRPTGGLPGVRFPLSLLRQLRHQGGPCSALAAERLLEELRISQRGSAGRWQLAQSLWSSVDWDAQHEELLEEAANLLRQWLGEAEVDGGSSRAQAAVQLFSALPLQRLPRPEELLAPPVPAHVLAMLGHRCQLQNATRLAVLESENVVLREHISHLQNEIRRSS